MCRQSSWPASILHLRIQSFPCDSKHESFVNQKSAGTLGSLMTYLDKKRGKNKRLDFTRKFPRTISLLSLHSNHKKVFAMYFTNISSMLWACSAKLVYPVKFVVKYSLTVAKLIICLSLCDIVRCGDFTS